MKRRILAYAPALFWAVFVLFLGGRSNIQGPSIDLPVDKLAHFVLYGILGALAAWGWQRRGRRPRWYWLVLGAILVGALDELHQRSVAGRSAEFADWIADALGSLVGFLVVSRWVGSTHGKGRE